MNRSDIISDDRFWVILTEDLNIGPFATQEQADNWGAKYIRKEASWPLGHWQVLQVSKPIEIGAGK